VYPHQAERLNEALEHAKVEAFIATSPQNIAYLTGFRSLTEAVFHTEQYVVFTRHGTALVVPVIDSIAIVADAVDVDHVVCFGEFRAEASEPLRPETQRALELIANPAATPADALATTLEKLGTRPGTIGLDETNLTPERWRHIADRLHTCKLVPAGNDLLAARRVKGPYELECLGRALRITEEALNAVIQMLSPGVTEREAVTVFNTEVIKRDAIPIPALVAIGDRTAIPAPWPADRALRRGDLVRMEVGCVFRGYHATLARMAVMGEPSPRQERAYRAIQAGLEAAIAAIKPGLPAGRVCERVIAATREAGLPRYDRLQVGHGIGLEPYERPKLASGIDTPLEAGEVLCVEAPYYELGWAGFNLKDTLIVTSAGARAVNISTRSLVVLD
jgi:Xaa-Pro dipeptidase